MLVPLCRKTLYKAHVGEALLGNYCALSLVVLLLLRKFSLSIAVDSRDEYDGKEDANRDKCKLPRNHEEHDNDAYGEARRANQNRDMRAQPVLDLSAKQQQKCRPSRRR